MEGPGKSSSSGGFSMAEMIIGMLPVLPFLAVGVVIAAPVILIAGGIMAVNERIHGRPASDAFKKTK